MIERRRLVDGISDPCNQGRHDDCKPPCPRCTCHPRRGYPVAVPALVIRGAHHPPEAA